MSTGVEALYRNYGLLADAEAAKDIVEHASAYERIIEAIKGSDAEKKLAPSFITRFFGFFPSFQEAATDAILDLIEDEDPQIRRLAIKTLPDICKASKDESLFIRIADVLTQLLLIEETTELEFVKKSMASILEQNTKFSLIGIFDQIMGEDEIIREKGLEYICGPLMAMKHKLFSKNEGLEEVLFELVKKVLVDVTGKEFEMLLDLLSKTSYISSTKGSIEFCSLISQQAELTSKFNADNVEFIEKLLTCFRQALKFMECGATTSPFIEYICTNILLSLDMVKEQTRQEVLQLLAESCFHPINKEVVHSSIQSLYDYLLVHLPQPSDAAEQPKLHFSIVECVLFTFHKFCQLLPNFFSVDQKLREFRIRLQYFARGSQAYHAQLITATRGLDTRDDQNKLREIALITTSNINTLIKDFFHNPPSCKADVFPSWIPKEKDRPVPPRKRPSDTQQPISKRKHSPIRFESSSKDVPKKEALAIYSPPKDKFSKKLTGMSKRTSQRGGRGNKGGRSKTTWRQ